MSGVVGAYVELHDGGRALQVVPATCPGVGEKGLPQRPGLPQCATYDPLFGWRHCPYYRAFVDTKKSNARIPDEALLMAAHEFERQFPVRTLCDLQRRNCAPGV